MILTRMISSAWCTGARRIAFITFVTILVAVVASSQTEVTPYSLFQYAILSGTRNTITVTRVPVVTAKGNLIYKDLVLPFVVDGDGNLSLAPENTAIVDAPNLLSSSFMAGNYVGPGSILNGKTPATVSGPGVLSGGESSWSFAAAAGADTCTYPNSATWHVGSIENSPVTARLKKAGITSTAWSYGIASGPYDGDRCTNGGSFRNENWPPGTLIGVSQSGNAITFASFSHTGCKGCNFYDTSAPVDQITYRLVP